MKTDDDVQGIGRHGRLSLKFRKEGLKTILRDSFSVIPMRVFPPFYPDNSGCAYFYMVNPTSGLVGGDRIESQIVVETNAHVFITAPAATKVYRSTGAYSESVTIIKLEENAVLEYLPRYVIPFAGSMYSQKTRVTMDAGSSLFFLDAFTTGRTARQEHLQFKEYRSETEIVYCGQPVVTDRFVLGPEREDYGTLGFLESYTASAVLYILFENRPLLPPLLSSIEECLHASGDIAGGASALPLNGAVVRLLGNSARSLEKTIFHIFAASRKMLYGMDSAALERLVS